MGVTEWLQNGKSVATVYAAVCARLLPLLATGWATGAGRNRLKAVAGLLGWERAPGKAQAVPLATLVPGDSVFRICAPKSEKMNVSYYELCCINSIVSALRPSRIFEFGTFDGRTTLNLAANSPQHATIWTIDLPESPGALLGHRLGERFLDRPERSRIHQLQCDTTKFDFAPHAGRMQFIFVDACHDYEFVRSDTRAALQLADPAGAVILWHDYGSWPGVTEAVDEVLLANPGRFKAFRIESTSLAGLIVGSALGGTEDSCS